MRAALKGSGAVPAPATNDAAILAEARSKAQGIEKENEALGGAGGRTMVKLKIAEALQGKRIVFMPSGKGSTLQTVDMNQLMSQFAVTHAEKGAPK